MQTVGEYVTQASTRLNDQRQGRTFTRWGRALLLTYLNLGLAEIAAYRPEAFATTQAITLAPGVVQTIPAGAIQRVVSNEDGTPISEGDYGMAAAFAAYDPCPSSVSFKDGNPVIRIQSYAVDQADTRRFYVDPAVPAGVTAKVNIAVIGAAPQYALADWNNHIRLDLKFSNDLLNFMAAKGFGMNQDSRQSMHNSDSLYRLFYTSMGAKYKRDVKYMSGNYLADDKAEGGDRK